MHPRRLIAMLEQADNSFQDLFYPQRLRCPLEKRIVRDIEENWPAYFPTRKECRGSSWGGVERTDGAERGVGDAGVFRRVAFAFSFV
jgi:hypothetical protein